MPCIWYNCDEPWQSYFGSTFAHNTIVIDRADQMQRASRFMWFDWTKAKLVMHKSFESGFAKVMQGEHYGYCRKGSNLIHRRAVLSLGGVCWLVIDDVLGTGRHDIRLCWQLGDVNYKLADNSATLETETGPVNIRILGTAEVLKCEVLRGDESKPTGWQSLYYGSRVAAPTLVVSSNTKMPARIVTLIGLGDIIKDAASGEANTVSWILESAGQRYVVRLNSIGACDKGVFVFAQQNSRKVSLISD